MDQVTSFQSNEQSFESTQSLEPPLWDALTLLSDVSAKTFARNGGGSSSDSTELYVVAQSLPLRPFDGRELYQSAYDAIMQYHLLLNSGEEAKKFSDKWQHKFDQTDQLDTEAGADEAVRGMLKSLGLRFDYFHDRKSIEEQSKRSGGDLVGIGVRLGLTQKNAEGIINKDSNLIIEDVTEGSPAARAGLQAADVITAIDGLELNGTKLVDAVNMVRGRVNNPVTLSIERMHVSGETEKIEVTPSRERVRLQNVWTRDLGDGMAYVKLHDFDGTARTDMERALRAARSAKGLVVDLRANPGGALTNAHDIAAMILEDGAFLVSKSRSDGATVKQEQGFNKYFEYRVEHPDENASTGQVLTTKRPELLIPHDTPIVVLVDEGSASSAEILSGALQYNRRATIVGMPTHGKGEGQSIVALPFGRKLHVTSMEFAPGRQPNNWSGVIPDIEIAKGQNRAIDAQLNKAMEVLRSSIHEVERKTEKRREREEERRKELQNTKGA